MIPVFSFRNQNVAVFGLGESGKATALALIAGGALVSAFDDSAVSVDAAASAGVPVEDLRIADWQSFAALVLAPGVPLTHPKPAWPVVSARAAGIEVIGDIELFCRERTRNVPAAPFIAITGTNGKSTTTALIAHILSATGREVELGGNIGRAILSLEPPRTGRYHVIECSSFQIDLAPSLNPSIGVLLNITPDHLDRHGTLAAYARIKERLVAQSEIAVIAIDDEWTQSTADRLQRAGKRVIRISARRPLADGVYAEGADIYVASNGNAVKFMSLDGISTLRGQHNAQNAAAAIAVCRASGLSDAEIATQVQTFAGLPHRLEEVGRRGRVTFINDSKATNADATAKALAVVSRIYWIAGGRAKAGGIASLKPYFPRIEKAYLIGEAAKDFANTLGDDVPWQMCGTLQNAVNAAAADAADDNRPGDPTVLLSPACASYDQFQNFERRGDAFRLLVRQLNGVTSQGRAA
ncbi:MAG: UDP-N-acetylmuramoyl-L-alanine--D-glutamate ligase [Bauldia sp.]